MKNFAYIDEALSGIRPLWFLIAYIAAIPVFGGLYTVLAAHEFYAPYAQREPSAIADRMSLIDMLTDASRRAARGSTDGLLVGKWRIDPNSLRVVSVDIKDDSELLFTLRFEAAIASNPDSGQLGGPLALKVSKDSGKFTDAAGTRSFRIVDLQRDEPTTSISPSSQSLTEAIFKPTVGTGYQVPVIELKADEEEKVVNFFRGVDGDPASFSGEYFRMTYVSAVVITTLGLGDIAPISPMARTLVAAEAVIGILLAGLFLNALASQMSKREDRK